MVDTGSADLHIRVGIPPCIRMHGLLERVDGPPCKPEDTEELMSSIASDDNIQEVRENGISRECVTCCGKCFRRDRF